MNQLTKWNEPRSELVVTNTRLINAKIYSSKKKPAMIPIWMVLPGMIITAFICFFASWAAMTLHQPFTCPNGESYGRNI